MLETDLEENALLVVSLSARPYVQAAKKSGYYVVAIDAFVDQETVRAADETHVVALGALGFEARALVNTIKKLKARRYIGCIVGSGFEMQPDLLAEVNQYVRVLGNSISVIKQVNHPDQLFPTLDRLKVAYPQRINDADQGINQINGIIQKRIGGAGGNHIRWHHEGLPPEVAPNTYFQAFVSGELISVLFMAGIADGQIQVPVEVIGFNAQWVNGDEVQPFRFGGLASHALLPDAVCARLENIAESLTQSIGLIGLNSIDVIVCEGEVLLLEINPRLSLSLALYWQDYAVDLMKLHVALCLAAQRSKRALSQTLNTQVEMIGAIRERDVVAGSHAIGVVYANSDCTIGEQFNWPSWVVDTPVKGASYQKGEPICSVVAFAVSTKSAESAKRLVQSRTDVLLESIATSD